MITILMNGCNGKMGQFITKLCKDNTSYQITAGVTLEPDSVQNNYPVFKSFDSVSMMPDLVIDFSHPSMLPSILKFCVNNKIPLLSGTTGFGHSDFDLLIEAAKHIPV